MKAKTHRAVASTKSQKAYQKPQTVKPENQEFLCLIGESLEDLRKNKQISKSELCRQVDISRFGYDLIINGSVYWNLQTVLKILAYFNIDALQFFISLKDNTGSKK